MTQTDTKTKILDLAARLLQEKGYNAFSYQDISTELGIRNAAVHYHFPTKEDLGNEVIRRVVARFEAMMQQARQAELSPWEQLDQFFGIFRNYLENNHRICLLGALGSAYYTLPETMQQHTQAFVQTISDWLAQLLENGRASGHFHFKGEAHHKAITISSSLTGALQLSRVTQKADFYAILEQIRLDLQA